MNEAVALFGRLVAGVIIAILASYFTVKFSLKRFYAERWWERKVDAYTMIIESIYSMMRFSRVKKEDYGQGPMVSEEKLNELAAEYSKAHWDIEKATDLGSFVVSNDAVGELEALRNRPLLEWGKFPSWEVWEEDYRAYEACLRKIVAIAKKDLRVK